MQRTGGLTARIAGDPPPQLDAVNDVAPTGPGPPICKVQLWRW